MSFIRKRGDSKNKTPLVDRFVLIIKLGTNLLIFLAISMSITLQTFVLFGFNEMIFLYNLCRKRKRSIASDLRMNHKMVKLGNPELTKLWNLEPDNSLACKAKKRLNIFLHFQYPMLT